MATLEQCPSEAESLENFPVPFERKNDTSSEELIDYGKDIQAIPWDRLQWTREEYRCGTLSNV